MAEFSVLTMAGDSIRPPSLAGALRRRATPPSLSEYRLKEIQLQLGDLTGDEKAARKQHDAGFLLCTAAPSGMISLVVHLSVLIALGLYMPVPTHFGAETISIVVVAVEEETEEELPEVEIPDEVVVDRRCG